MILLLIIEQPCDNVINKVSKKIGKIVFIFNIGNIGS